MFMQKLKDVIFEFVFKEGPIVAFINLKHFTSYFVQLDRSECDK